MFKIDSQSLVCGLFLVGFSWAAPLTVKDLYQQTSRPTVEQFMEIYAGSLPSENPFSYHSHLSWSNPGRNFKPTEDDFKKLVAIEAARTIARMEKAFPGAIWASVGRDAATFGDVLDAFYIAQGQKGRVKRLEVSTGSFQDDDIFKQYLSELGAPLDPATIEGARPFVFFDRTSYGTWRVSQSQQILQFGYRDFVKAGGNARVLLRKFNFLTTEPVSIGTSSAGSRGINADVIGKVDIETFFKSQEEVVKNGNPPSRLLGLESNLSDLAEWHGSFGRLKKNTAGKIESVPGPPNDDQMKERILWELYEIVRTVSTPEFLNEVSKQARVLGYDIHDNLKIVTVTSEEVLKKRTKEFREDLEDRKTPVAEMVAKANKIGSKEQVITFYENHIDLFVDRNDFTLKEALSISNAVVSSSEVFQKIQDVVTQKGLLRSVDDFTSIAHWPAESRLVVVKDFIALKPSVDQLTTFLAGMDKNRDEYNHTLELAIKARIVSKINDVVQLGSADIVQKNESMLVSNAENVRELYAFYSSQDDAKAISFLKRVIASKKLGIPGLLAMRVFDSHMVEILDQFFSLKPSSEQINLLLAKVKTSKVKFWKPFLTKLAPLNMAEQIVSRGMDLGYITAQDIPRLNLGSWLTQSVFMRVKLKNIGKQRPPANVNQCVAIYQ